MSRVLGRLLLLGGSGKLLLGSFGVKEFELIRIIGFRLLVFRYCGVSV